MGRPRTLMTREGREPAIPTSVKPIVTNHTHCTRRVACDGAELPLLRRTAGVCEACMRELRNQPAINATVLKNVNDQPARVWDHASRAEARARGAAASARVNTGKRKRMNPTYVINEKGAKRARDYAEAEKRTKPKRMKEPPAGLQVVGVKYIGKRAGKKKAA